MELSSSIKKKLKSVIAQKIRELGEKQITIKTTYPLSGTEKKLFFSKFPNLKSGTVTYKTEKSIIGGFIVEFGSTIIDASLSSHIDALTSHL